MSTIVQSKNVFVSQEMEEKIEHILNKLFKHHTRLQKITATVERDREKWYQVAMTAHWPGKKFAIQGRQPNLYTAILDCAKRLNRAIRKNKEKQIDLTRK